MARSSSSVVDAVRCAIEVHNGIVERNIGVSPERHIEEFRMGILLVIVGAILPAWAILLFRRKSTEIDPTTPANRKLIADNANAQRQRSYEGLRKAGVPEG